MALCEVIVVPVQYQGHWKMRLYLLQDTLIKLYVWIMTDWKMRLYLLQDTLIKLYVWIMTDWKMHLYLLQDTLTCVDYDRQIRNNLMN